MRIVALLGGFAHFSACTILGGLRIALQCNALQRQPSADTLLPGMQFCIPKRCQRIACMSGYDMPRILLLELRTGCSWNARGVAARCFGQDVCLCARSAAHFRDLAVVFSFCCAQEPFGWLVSILLPMS